MNQVSRLLKLFLKIILCLAAFLVPYIVTTYWPKVFLTPDTSVIYRYQVENNSGESVTCAVIGWYPRVSEKAQIWQPAPNTRGPAHGIFLNAGGQTEMALSTSDFCGVRVLVRGNSATETRVLEASSGLRFSIPRLESLPLASDSLLTCFDGGSVSLPAQ